MARSVAVPATRRGGLLRGLVRLLVFLMVPVVVVATPSVASAAVNYGPKVSGSFELSGNYSGDWLTCSLSAWWVVPESGNFLNQPHVKVPSLQCSAGWWVEGGYVTLHTTFSGAGAGCSDSATHGPVNAWTSGNSLSIPGATYTVPATCDMTTFCVTGEVDNPRFPDAHLGDEQCIQLPAGVAPTEPTSGPTCADFASLGSPWVDVTIPGTWWQVEWGLNGASWANQSAQYDTIVVWRRSGDGSIHRGYPGHEPRAPNPSGPIALNAPATRNGVGGLNSANVGTYDSYDFIGLQIAPRWYATGSNGRFLHERPQEYNGGILGLTRRADCVFYWGEKIAQVENSSEDDPAGFLDTPDGGGAPIEPSDDSAPPAVEGGDCSFKMSDPSTWLEGGMCAVVGLLTSMLGLLGDIVDAVLGLPALIWNAVSDGLGALFMPADGYLDSQGQRVSDAWEDTAPGAWADTVTGLDPGSISGCGGVPVSFPIPGVADVDMQLGAACSGAMENAANIVRLAISAGVVVGGGWACLRALGSGFGWSPGAGPREGVSA